MASWKRFISALFCLISWKFAFGMGWKTTDAVIQDVSLENAPVKLKRLPTTLTEMNNFGSPSSMALKTSSDHHDEDEGLLVFEGRYFKPNEVPPPPTFMIGSNWQGASSSSYRTKQKQPQSKKNGNFYFTVGTGSTLSPSSQKFREEIAKDFETIDKDLNEKTVPEDKVSATNSKNVIASTSVPHPEDLHYYEEHSLSEDEFHDTPKCYTATDTLGRCLPFKECYPVVFNVINGDLRNPGLAKLLYQSSGPCNASLELDFALNNKGNDKAFINAKFYNQSICCPKFKHPATLMTSRDDVRSTRLINDTNQNSSETLSSKNRSSSETSGRGHVENDKDVHIFTAVDSTTRALEVDDSSVEASQSGFSDSSDELHGDTERDVLMMGDAEERLDDENIRVAVSTGIVKENVTTEVARIEDADLEEEDETVSVQDRRGNRDKEIVTNTMNDYETMPPLNLSPNRCRHQIYGMPRGHWPWMVALVISSRHICSGALIGSGHVVTSAHCVHLLDDTNMRKLRVIIGDRVMYSSVDGPHFWRKVTKITTHFNYNQHTFANDIAVLKLNSDVPFSRNVQPISLSDLVSPVDGSTFSKGIVAGWSGANIGQPSFEARTEMETVVDIMDKTECLEAYRGFVTSGVASNAFCTKAANNTCVADSGAPLIVRVQNCWVLAGIMSWGLGCSHFPEVYTDVTLYASWIRKHTV